MQRSIFSFIAWKVKKKKKQLKEDDHKLFLKDHSENKMEPIFAYFNF